MPRTFSLQLSAIEMLAGELGLPRRWAPFDITHVGTTTSARTAYIDETWADLRARGLAGRGNRLDVDVENALRALTGPDVVVVVRVSQVGDDRPVLYRAASGSGVGVLALAVGDRADIEVFKPEELVGAIAGELPRYDPVPLREASMLVHAQRRPAPADDSGAPAVFADDVPDAPSGAERRAIEQFTQWPVDRLGGYELSVRGADGRLRHLGTTMFTDTHRGRFLIFSEPVPDGSTRRRYVPSDGSHLRRWLHQQIADAREDLPGNRRR